MPQVSQIVYTHRELVELLIKDRGIHDGIWGLYLRFGLGATNVGESETQIQPAAIIPVLEIGLQKFETETTISLDAAKVNPPPKETPKRR